MAFVTAAGENGFNLFEEIDLASNRLRQGGSGSRGGGTGVKNNAENKGNENTPEDADGGLHELYLCRNSGK